VATRHHQNFDTGPSQRWAILAAGNEGDGCESRRRHPAGNPHRSHGWRAGGQPPLARSARYRGTRRAPHRPRLGRQQESPPTRLLLSPPARCSPSRCARVKSSLPPTAVLSVHTIECGPHDRDHAARTSLAMLRAGSPWPVETEQIDALRSRYCAYTSIGTTSARCTASKSSAAARSRIRRPDSVIGCTPAVTLEACVIAAGRVVVVCASGCRPPTLVRLPLVFRLPKLLAG